MKFLLFIPLCLSAFLHLGQDSYQSYCNAAYEFCMSYPANLVNPQPESYIKDGREFTAKKGKAKITTWGNKALAYVLAEENPFNTSKALKDEFAGAMEGKKVTYKVLKDNWFVVSGINKEGNIFYQKTIQKEHIFINVLLTYPESEKATWNPQCSKVANSLKFN